MNKEEAKKRLTSIEGEVKELRRIIESPELDKKITDAQTFEEVCTIMGVKPEDILPYSNPSNVFQKGINAFAKLTFIADAFNGDWTADWTNTNQKKWYPYFDLSSGFRFFGALCLYAFGSRFSPLLSGREDGSECRKNVYINI